MNLLPPTLFLGLSNLPFHLSNSPLQAVHPQPLRRLHRRHLAFQRHPHGIEHPGRYPVLLQVSTLQRCSRPARRSVGKALTLYLAVQFAVGRQPSIAIRTVPALINRCGSGTCSPAALHQQMTGQAGDGVSWEET